MSASYLDAVTTRRSYYSISDEPILSNEEIKTLLEKAVINCPSAFNTQGARAILFVGEPSKKIWSTVSDIFTAAMPPPVKAQNVAKIANYSTGYGTIGFFEDQAVVKDIAAKIPTINESVYQLWSEQSNAMLQHIVWTSLTLEGYGASLQHHPYYHPEIQPTLLKEFNLPETWKITALMPFGKPTGPPGQPGKHIKDVIPVETRVKVVV